MTLIQITKVKGPGIHTLANIVSNTISLGGIATASNFKTGTSNLHSAGVEVAGVNVLGADTPIGTGATIYDAGGAIFTGVVTATSFSGSIAGTADLASGLTGTPSITVQDVVAVGATFTGNVSIGGTLTYEDVTNIDSVGIVTAREGVFIPDTKQLKIGNTAADPDLQIHHTSGNHSIIHTETGNLSLSTNSSKVQLSKATGDGTLNYVNMLEANAGGSVDLFYAGNKKFETTNTGTYTTGIATVTDNLQVIGSQNAKLTSNQLIFDRAGTSYIDNTSNSGSLSFRVSASNTVGLHIDSNADVHIPRKLIHSGDTDTFMEFTGNHIHFDTAGSERFRIASDGKVLIGDGDTYSPNGLLHIVGDDNSNGPELYLQVNNNNTTDNIGALWFGNNVDKSLVKLAGHTHTANNTADFTVSTSSGGTLAEVLRIYNTNSGNGGIAKFTSPTSGDMLNLQNSSASGQGLIFGVDTSASPGYTYWKNNTTASYDAAFIVGGTEKLRIEAGGHILPGAAGTQNLGSTTKEFNNLYLGDSGKAYFGLDQDFSIWHNNSHGLIKNTTGRLYVLSDDLWFKNEADNKTSARFFEGNEVFLYYNGNIKLSTSAKGITVDGEVAASQDYPNQRPSVDFNFVSVKKLDSRFTYERTGPASYTDEFGIVQLVGANIPRFDHNPTTRESKGLLIEESRTNDWAYSTDLSKITASGGFAGTQTYNTTTAPDGTTTADSHKGSGSSARHSVYWEPEQHTSAQLDNSSVYTCSVFVKQITGNSAERYCELETASHGTWSNAGNSPTFDLQNGTMSNNASSGITGTIESYPDGWYRISMTSTTGTTTNDTGFYFNHTDSNSNSTQTLATTEGFHLWGAQIEKGNFITSYIPTSGSTATRGQGFAVIDGEELSDFYNPNTSTVICQFDASNWVTYNPNKYDRVWSFSNHNTETDTIEMFKQNSSNSQVRWRIRTSNTNVLGAANYTYSTTRPKLGFAWQLNDAAVSIDGATVAGTGDSGIPLPSITKLSLGNSGIENNNGAHGLTGWIRRFIYYPIKVSDSQLITLTS